MKRTIDLEGRMIEYNLERKNVKNLNLRIKADQSVNVSANHMIADHVIDDFLRSKADYILSALDRYAEMEKYAPKPKAYVDGESFRILGHDLRLIVRVGTKNGVFSDGKYITLTVIEPADFDLKRRLIEKWIKKECQNTIQRVCESIYPRFQKYGIEFPQLRFRNMVSRWGSCQPKRKALTFNILLIEAPLSCIEYVVTHEFVHFLQPDHSRKFYQYLNMFMPDWKERKRELEKTYHYFE